MIILIAEVLHLLTQCQQIGRRKPVYLIFFTISEPNSGRDEHRNSSSCSLVSEAVFANPAPPGSGCPTLASSVQVSSLCIKIKPHGSSESFFCILLYLTFKKYLLCFERQVL